MESHASSGHGYGTIQCPEHGDVFFVKNGRIHWNAHVHSDVSDGQQSRKDLSSTARVTGINQGVSDHNDLGHDEAHPGVIAHNEILTRQNVDVVVMGAHRQMREFARDVVHHKRARHNPVYSPTGICIHELVREIVSRDLDGILAHYFAPDGASRLPLEEQVAILEAGRGHLFLEHNAMMSRRQNALAEALAAATDMPILFTGDTHWGHSQYAGTWSSIPVGAVDQSQRPLVKRVLNAFRHHGHHMESEVYSIPWWEKAATVTQIASRIGVGPMASFVKDNMRRLFGLLPTHPVEKIAGLRKRPLQPLAA